MAISDEIIPICALKDNYIWMFFDKNSRNAWIIDPGEILAVIRALQHYQLTLDSIFITHHHRDHSGGVQALLDEYPSAKVYASHRSPLPFITHHLKEGDIVACSNIQLKALEIPGHTLDHTAYVGNGWLFAGDTLFSAGCGKIFEGTPLQMYQSLQKLMMLPEDTQLFCGHEYTLANLYFAQMVEPDNNHVLEKMKQVQEQRHRGLPTLPSTLKEEKTFNPFLRCREEDFAKLREWKSSL